MIRQLLRLLRDRVLGDVARRSDLQKLYNQVAGLLEIKNAMSGEPVLGPLGGWTMSPDAMALIAADLQDRDRPVVVEFGSGQSTVIFAAMLKHRRGRLYTVEHDAAYAASVKRRLESCGLSHHVKIILAPLVELGGRPGERSYDLSGMPNVLFDVALVDGPPITNGQFARLVPLRWAVEHLNKGAVIYLDDCDRIAEQRCLTCLVSEYPNVRITRHGCEKGLAEIR